MLLEKLSEIQTELNVAKTKYNDFAEFDYRSCEDILKAVKPYLKKHKLVLLLTDTVDCKGNNRIYITATAKLIEIETKEEIEVSASAREPESPKKKMDESQTTGSTSSYARKYALNGLFDLDDGVDSDSINNKPESTEKLISKAQIKKLEELGTDLDRLAAYYKVDSIEKIKYKDAADAINKKEAAKANKGGK